MRKISGSFIALAIAAFAVVLPVAADAVTVSPPYYDYTSVNKGDTLIDVIKIFNDGNADMTLYPIVSNFTYKEGDETTGTPDWYDAGKDPFGTALASWVTVDTDPIYVKAGERFNLPFSLNVPENASPGGHFGGILLSTQPPDDKGVVAIGSQVGVLILMRVEGDVKEEARIAEFGFSDPQPWYNHLPVGFFVRFENSGNIHLRPTGNMFITDWTGRQVGAVPVNDSFRSVLPQSIRRFSFEWVKDASGGNSSALYREWSNFAIGRHTANLVLAYGTDNKLVTATAAFYVWPWRIMLIAVGILAFIILFLTVGKSAWEKSVIRKYERMKKK
jgi:hypothetical protein